MTSVIASVLLALSLGAIAVTDARSQVRVESFSGSGQAGFANSNGQVGQFNRPHALAIDVVLTTDGSLVVSEENNHRLRKILLK